MHCLEQSQSSAFPIAAPNAPSAAPFLSSHKHTKCRASLHRYNIGKQLADFKSCEPAELDDMLAGIKASLVGSEPEVRSVEKWMHTRTWTTSVAGCRCS